jgi:hypothetical protein
LRNQDTVIAYWAFVLVGCLLSGALGVFATTIREKGWREANFRLLCVLLFFPLFIIEAVFYVFTLIFIGISRDPIPLPKTEYPMESSLYQPPIVISKYSRIIFEKSILATVGSLCVVFIGTGLLSIAYPFLGRLLWRQLDNRSVMLSFFIISGLLAIYPFLVGFQTLIRRRKVEITPDGLSYMDYCTATDTHGFVANSYNFPAMFIESDKRFFSWQDIDAIERKGRNLRIHKQQTSHESKDVQSAGKENIENVEQIEEISLTGFDATADKIGTTIEEYYDRYKNGYLFEPEAENEPLFYWNKSATLVLTLSVLHFCWFFFITCDWFNELTVVKIFDDMIVKNVLELYGQNENVCMLVLLLIYNLPSNVIWFFLVVAMWKAIPVSVATFQPCVAAFISLILPPVSYFIVFRKWAEDLNKAAGRNGQGNICVVVIVTLFCLFSLTELPYGIIISKTMGGNFADRINSDYINVYLIIKQIVTAVFLVHVCASIRLLKTCNRSRADF